MNWLVQVNEPDASRRRIYFDLKSTGNDPVLNEGGGQPQISVDGGAFANSGIGPLQEIGFGRYYAELDTSTVATAGQQILSRYKSLNTAECPGDSVLIVDYDPVHAGSAVLQDATKKLWTGDGGGVDVSRVKGQDAVLITDAVTVQDLQRVGMAGNKVKLTSLTRTNQVVSGTEIIVTRDASGNDPVAKVITDSQGEAIIYLPDGTYYRWAQHARYSFVNPVQFQVPEP